MKVPLMNVMTRVRVLPVTYDLSNQILEWYKAVHDLADLSHRNKENRFPLAACLKDTSIVMPAAPPTKNIPQL
jgi:hypothetical protein